MGKVLAFEVKMNANSKKPKFVVAMHPHLIDWTANVPTADRHVRAPFYDRDDKKVSDKTWLHLPQLNYKVFRNPIDIRMQIGTPAFGLLHTLIGHYKEIKNNYAHKSKEMEMIFKKYPHYRLICYTQAFITNMFNKENVRKILYVENRHGTLRLVLLQPKATLVVDKHKNEDHFNVITTYPIALDPCRTNDKNLATFY